MEDLICLHGDEWFRNQKIAGKCVATILADLSERIKETKTYTGTELKKIANDIFERFDCTATFMGYKGFPASICLSVNKELVHGIPKDIPILEGDVVTFDLGATYRGAIADAATTVIKGKPRDPRHIEMIDTCKKALMAGISAIKIGERIGAVGYAIHNVIKKTPFNSVTNYGGHHITTDTPHDAPFVHNRSQKTEGNRVQIGEVFAIEPMVVLGNATTRVLNDGWTVVCDGISVHEEHSIFVTKDGPQIQTLIS